MLKILAAFLEPWFSALNAFNYITLRSVLSALTALGISLLFGPKLIAYLERYRACQYIREVGPKTHLSKQGTPTMGGVLPLLAIASATLLWGDLSNRYIILCLIAMVAFAVIGFMDDWLKMRAQSSHGLKAAQKFLLQSIVGFVLVYALYSTSTIPAETALIVPVFKDISIPLGLWFIPLAWFVVVGFSNAVNLTDGLDGLAIMPAIMVVSALGIFAYASGHINIANYFSIPHLPLSGELLVFCGAIAGAGLGFLWFNTYPAQVFMGDTGALAFGGVIGLIAVMVRQEIVLLIMGGVFVIETLSVMAQVVSYKLTGKRIFNMAPLHHHFELRGWPEPRVIVRFWIITVILVLIGLATLKIR